MLALHQSMCIPNYGLSSSRHARDKHKDKVVNVLHSNQNIGVSYMSKLNLTKLKDIYTKMLKKLDKNKS